MGTLHFDIVDRELRYDTVDGTVTLGHSRQDTVDRLLHLDTVDKELRYDTVDGTVTI